MLNNSSALDLEVNRHVDVNSSETLSMEERENNTSTNVNRRHSSFLDSPVRVNHTTATTPVCAPRGASFEGRHDTKEERDSGTAADNNPNHTDHNSSEVPTLHYGGSRTAAAAPPPPPPPPPETRASQSSAVSYTRRKSSTAMGSFAAKRGGGGGRGRATTGMPAPPLLAPGLKLASVFSQRRGTGANTAAAADEAHTNEPSEDSTSMSAAETSMTVGPSTARARGGPHRCSTRSSMCLPPLIQQQQQHSQEPAPGGVSPVVRRRRSTGDQDVRLSVSEDGDSEAEAPRLSLHAALPSNPSSSPLPGITATPTAAGGGGYCLIVPPVHESIFFPQGFEGLPPVLLHYLRIGRWRTVPGGWDYYAHRRLRRKEAVGHTVRWLHNATPRDRFVFIVDPVEATKAAAGRGEEGGEGAAAGEEMPPLVQLRQWWERKREQWLGTAPAFAYNKGKLFSKHADPPLGDELVQDVLDLHEESRRARGPASPGSVFLPSRSPVHALERERHFPNASDGGRTPSRASSPVRRSSGALPALTPTTAAEPQRPSFLRRLLGGARPAPEVRRGVEAVEVLHADITAADFSARLTTTRFSMEVREAHTYYFASLAEAMTYYGCQAAMPLVRQQIAEGRSHRISRTTLRQQQQQSGAPDLPQQPIASPSHAGLSTSNNSSFASARRSEHGGMDFPVGGAASLADALRQSEHQPRTPSAALHRTSSMQDFFYDHHHHTTSSHLDPHHNNNNDNHHHHNNNSTSKGSPSGGGSSCPSTPLPFLQLPSTIAPVPTSKHTDTIVTLHSEDPNFVAVLREVLLPENGTHPYTADLQTQKRLLALYEAGMPAWTSFVVSAGLPYRRALRLLYVLLYHLWPAVSLAVGLYDLYKHLPQLKRFLAHTLDPLNRWVERHFTLRVSVLVTYLFSVGLTTVTSLRTFFQQLSLVRVFGPLVRLLSGLLQLPFYFVFDTLWTAASIVYSFAALLFLSVKVLLAGPFMLVLQLAPLQSAGATAVQGTTLTVRWWRAWTEFWVTVASPVKNAAKAWYDGAMHVLDTALRREASIRRWYAPQLARLLRGAEEVQAGLSINRRLWLELVRMPAGTLLLVQSLALTVVFALVWVDVRQPPWGERTEGATPAESHESGSVGRGGGRPTPQTFPVVERLLHPTADALGVQILRHNGACVGITKIESFSVKDKDKKQMMTITT